MEVTNDRALANYTALLEDFKGDRAAARECLKYLNWLINDIEIFEGIDLQEYKNIWEVAFNNHS